MLGYARGTLFLGDAHVVRGLPRMVKKHCSPKLDAFVDYASWDKMPTSEELKQLPSLGHLGLSMLSIDLTDFAWKDAE